MKFASKWTTTVRSACHQPTNVPNSARCEIQSPSDAQKRLQGRDYCPHTTSLERGDRRCARLAPPSQFACQSEGSNEGDCIVTTRFAIFRHESGGYSTRGPVVPEMTLGEARKEVARLKAAYPYQEFV